MDENAVGMCAELIFAPIDSSFADDAPLLPSGFRIIPLDSTKVTIYFYKNIYFFQNWLQMYDNNNNIKKQETSGTPNRTLDLASALEIGGSGNKLSNDQNTNNGTSRSVMTIAFEFAFESHMQESVATMSRQYVRSIISSVQRVALALSPSSHLNPNGTLQSPMGTPEAHTLARWISHSYRYLSFTNDKLQMTDLPLLFFFN